MFAPLRETVGLVKRGEDAVDSHGNPVPMWADAEPVAVYGYGPRSADGQAESYAQNRDVVTIGLTVYGPPELASQVSPLDRFEVPLGGDVYEVDGEIGDWNHGPFGWAPGVSISLKRIEG